LARSAGPAPMAWCPGAAPLAPSVGPGYPMEAAGTGTILGTASTPTHWQAGQAATTMPRLVTAPVDSAAAAEHVEPALRLVPPLILLMLLLEPDPLKQLLLQYVQYMPVTFATIMS